LVSPNSIEQNVGRLVVRVLWHQSPLERFGEDGGLQPIEQRAPTRGFGFKTISAGKRLLDARDNLSLLF